MKTDIFILRYGTHDELVQLASRYLRDAQLPIGQEPEAFAMRMCFVRHYLQTYNDVELQLHIIDGMLYVSGRSGTASFTI